MTLRDGAEVISLLRRCHANKDERSLRHPASGALGPAYAGLVNGCFYAMLSLGLAIIFGMLNIINFAHGALYMMGAVFTWIALAQFGIGYCGHCFWCLW